MSSVTGKPLGKPWVTFLVDAFSRRILSVYLTFDPPSYRSCMMALRICVLRFGRMPGALVVARKATIRGELVIYSPHTPLRITRANKGPLWIRQGTTWTKR